MASNSGVAAVCNAKQTQPDFNTQVPRVTNFTPPTIGDWSSVIQAILQLQWALIPIVNPPPVNNMLPEVSANSLGGGTVGGGGGSVGGGGAGNHGRGHKNPKSNQPKNPKQPNKVKWQQTSKQTELVKIVNPDDDTQYVIVRRTVSQTFQNPATGESLTINNPDGQSSGTP